MFTFNTSNTEVKLESVEMTNTGESVKDPASFCALRKVKLNSSIIPFHRLKLTYEEEDMWGITKIPKISITFLEKMW